MTQAISQNGSVAANGVTGPSAASSSKLAATASTSAIVEPPQGFESIVALAEQIASQPERLAFRNGDANLSSASLVALTDIFRLALQSESTSLEYIGNFLRDVLEPEAPSTRSSAKKRKRTPKRFAPHHSLFAPTPLDELATDGMGEEQIFEQLEYRGQAIENVLGKILVSVGGAADLDEDDEQSSSPRDEMQLKDDDDEEEATTAEEMVNSLSSLSDAELRAIGFDPAKRQQIMQSIAREGDLASSDTHDDDDDSEEGEAYPHGYPGASDISSDEDEEGHEAGSSKRVYHEPLKSEREQRKRKEEAEAAEIARARRVAELRRQMGMPLSEEEEEYMLDESDSEDDEDDEEEEEDSEEEGGPTFTAPAPSSSSSKRSKSLLDSLDDESDDAQKRQQRKRAKHPSLDDDFFSIDDFNRETEDGERREIFKQAGGGDDEDDEEFDLFQPVGGDDDDMDMDEDGGDGLTGGMDPSQIRYADFFEPPAGSSSGSAALKRSKGKGKGSRVGQGAKLAKQERDRLQMLDEAAIVAEEQGVTSTADQVAVDQAAEDSDLDDPSASSDEEDENEPSRSFTVRFAPTVAIRNIKQRRNKPKEDGLEDFVGPVTPELLKMLSEARENGEGDDDDEEDEAEEGSDSDDDEDDDDDDDEDEDDEDGHEYDSQEDDDEGEEDDEDEGELDDEEDEDEDEADASEADLEAGGSSVFDEEAEGDTARRFASDLFGDGDDADDDTTTEGSKDKLSSHERRLAALQSEIARLEAENVSGKDWTLSGEASSRARPKDSLLEETLDFEQSSRPTPTMTIEKTEALEDLIKKRILENRFDDVVARRVIAQPDYTPDYEVQDRKSSRSLAEEYGDDLQGGSGGQGEDGSVPMGDSAKRLQTEHTAILSLMDDLFNKLDALSNAHFTPKAPKTVITTLSNAPTLNVESGAPLAIDGGRSRLAPQEIGSSSAGSSRSNQAILDGSSSELTPADSKRLHQRKKKNLKRRRALEESARVERGLNEGAGKKVKVDQSSSGSGGGGGGGSVQKEKNEALKSLMGNRGVSVVGKGSGAGNGGRGGKSTLSKASASSSSSSSASASSTGKHKGRSQGELKGEKYKL